MKKTLLAITLLLTALMLTGCMHTLKVSVATPFGEIRKPTDTLCVGEEEVEREGKVGREDLRVVAYDENGDQIRPGEPFELTREEEEALALRKSPEVTAGGRRFVVEPLVTSAPPVDKIILVGTSEKSPPCEKSAKDNRTFPALINETGLVIYPGEKQDGPNDYVDEPAAAVLIIRIEGSTETAFQAIKDDLEDIGANDIQRTDGADGAGYNIRIEATLKEKKINVLFMNNEAGTFVVYNITKEE